MRLSQYFIISSTPNSQVQLKGRLKNQQQLQQAQQAIQQLQLDIKHGATVKQLQEDAETKRELMRQTAKAHDTEMRDATKQTDTVINNQTKLEIEQLKANLALVLAHLNLKTEKAAEAEAIERAI